MSQVWIHDGSSLWPVLFQIAHNVELLARAHEVVHVIEHSGVQIDMQVLDIHRHI